MNKKWFKENKVATFFLVLLLAVAVAEGVILYRRAQSYNIGMQNTYRQSFYDLSDSINNIDVALAKGLLTDDPKHLALIAMEIQTNSSYAKAMLGQLPINDTSLDNTQKFLAQVSDYTTMLSTKSINQQKMTDEEYNTMMNLSNYATALSSSILELEEKLLNTNGNFNEVISVSAEAQGSKEEGAPGNQFEQIETQFVDYPSLIYDGPFSDHLEGMEPEMLKGATEISKDQAKEVASNFLSYIEIQNIEDGSDSEGKIHTYGFVASTADENRKIYVDVTKIGGYVISVLDTKEAGEETMTNEEAIKKGALFLEEKGFHQFQYSYFERSSGNVTVNFAATQNDVFLYPDLIKVKVTTDDGSIIGFEAKNYIAHHKFRTGLTPLVTKEQAKANLNPKLTVESENLCVIPLNNGTEAFCYEFKGKYNNKSYLYYVNAKTGKEEKILLVVDTENGMLTM